MLILVPLKTQENAVAKWKKEKKKKTHQMGSSCIFETWQWYSKKLESKTERKEVQKNGYFLLVGEKEYNKIEKVARSQEFHSLALQIMTHFPAWAMSSRFHRSANALGNTLPGLPWYTD